MSVTLDSPIKTPSGLVFPNRLIKAAMAETMAEKHDPGDRYVTAYDHWSRGGWGGLLTGNVDVSTIYQGSPDNIALKPSFDQTTRDAWTRWALSAQQHGTPTIVQIVHPGRQSAAKSGNRKFTDKAIAPSPVPLNIGPGILDRLIAKVAFGTPREMTLQEIEEVIQQFASTAKLAYESGFKGVQLHAAHGYLLSQFLSPKTNLRTDAYGGTAAKRTRIVIEIIRAVRNVVPSTSCVGLKMNSVDVAGKENLEESLEQIGLIAEEQIDFLEISGGTFENPRMSHGDAAPDPNSRAARTAAREAFFLDFARAVRARYPSLILMVTGGFRSRKGIQDALESNACDLIGLGRPAAAWPHLPKDALLNKEVTDEEARFELPMVRAKGLVRFLPIKLLHVGADTIYYKDQINGMAVGKTPGPPKV